MEALRRSADQEEWALLSFSGYKGRLPVVGTFESSTFRLHRRRYMWRNDFAPNLYGEVFPDSGGTRIEVYFGLSPWTKIFMLLWLGMVGVAGGTVWIAVVIQLIRSHQPPTDHDWVGLIVPPAMILWGILLPKLGRFLSSWDEEYLLKFVEQAAAAQREWKTDLPGGVGVEQAREQR